MPPSPRRPHADACGSPPRPTRYDSATRPDPFAGRWCDGLERRAEGRLRHRLPCELHAEGRRYSGLVVDLSPRGLFVQTRASLRPGTPVGLKLRDGCAELPLHAAVARRRVVPARLLSVSHGGLGLRVVRAPAAYQRTLERLA